LDSSTDPCANNFRGPGADSEEETKTVQTTVDAFSRIQYAYVAIKAGLPNTFNGAIAYPYAFAAYVYNNLAVFLK
jgi:hypothetical protein